MRHLYLLYRAYFDTPADRQAFESDGSGAPSRESRVVYGHTDSDRQKALEELKSYSGEWFRMSESDAWSRGKDLIAHFEWNPLRQAAELNFRK